MSLPTIDLTPLRKAHALLSEALLFWNAQPEGTPLKPHLRSAVIQSFEFTYELSVRLLRRVLIERAESADRVVDLSFNDLLRVAADAQRWREWRLDLACRAGGESCELILLLWPARWR